MKKINVLLLIMSFCVIGYAQSLRNGEYKAHFPRDKEIKKQETADTTKVAPLAKEVAQNDDYDHSRETADEHAVHCKTGGGANVTSVVRYSNYNAPGTGPVWDQFYSLGAIQVPGSYGYWYNSVPVCDAGWFRIRITFGGYHGYRYYHYGYPNEFYYAMYDPGCGMWNKYSRPFGGYSGSGHNRTANYGSRESSGSNNGGSSSSTGYEKPRPATGNPVVNNQSRPSRPSRSLVVRSAPRTSPRGAGTARPAPKVNPRGSSGSGMSKRSSSRPMSAPSAPSAPAKTSLAPRQQMAPRQSS